MSTAANSDDRSGAWLLNAWRGAGRPTFSFGPETGVPGLRDIVAPARRRLRIISATILSGTIAATFVAFTLEEVFTAGASLVLEYTDTPVLDSAGEFERQALVRVAIDTEMDKIRSRNFAGLVVDALDLVSDPYFNTYLTPATTLEGPAAATVHQEALPPAADRDEGVFARIVASLPAAIRTRLADFGVGVKPSAAPPPAPALQRERAISTLLSKLDVSRSGQSLAMSVRISHPSPETAAAVVNAVADIYVHRSLEIRRESTANAIALLQERATELAARVAEAERVIADHRRDNQLDDKRRDETLRAEKAQITGRLTVARAQMAEADKRLTQLQDSANGDLEGNDAVELSPLMASLRRDEKRLLVERAGLASALSTGEGDNGDLADKAVSDLLNANVKLFNVREKIASELQRIILDVDNEAQAAAARVTQLEAALVKADQALQARSLAEITLRRLERELQTDRDRYDQVVERLGILDLQAESLQPSARVVSAAEIPTAHSFPKRKSIIAGGFLGSSMLAIILTLMLEGLDTRLRTERRTMQVSQLPNLAYIPEIASKWWRSSARPSRYIKEQPLSLFAEAIRTLYIGCRRSNINKPPQVLMVTSCLPGEGKTSLAYALAVTAAVTGQKTVLIDLDLHRHGATSMLDIEPQETSLVSYLADECALSDVIQSDCDTPGLDIIAVARRPQEPTWPMNSDRLPEMLDELRDLYDVVVVDTPPVLIVNDATWLSPFIDAAILVVRWGQTTEDTLRDAVKRLQANRVPMIGTAINRVDPRMQARYGYGGALAYYKYAGKYYSS